MQLSDTAVRKIKPTDKPQRVFDAVGLYLEVSPVGGKWWRLKYRFTGKEKRLSIGTYPDTDLADARAKRDEAHKLPARGVDPGVERKATKTAGDSMTTRAKHDPLLTRDALDNARILYLGQHDATDPRASPLYGDLADFPPAQFHVGEDEILLDDSRRFADLAATSGSTAELHVWQGMVHVFPANVTLLHAARDALDIAGAFLRRYLASEPVPPSLNND